MTACGLAVALDAYAGVAANMEGVGGVVFSGGTDSASLVAGLSGDVGIVPAVRDEDQVGGIVDLVQASAHDARRGLRRAAVPHHGAALLRVVARIAGGALGGVGGAFEDAGHGQALAVQAVFPLFHIGIQVIVGAVPAVQETVVGDEHILVPRLPGGQHAGRLIVRQCILMHVQPDVLLIGETLRLLRGFAGGPQRRQQHSRQNGDDRDDDQEFDQGEDTGGRSFHILSF